MMVCARCQAICAVSPALLLMGSEGCLPLSASNLGTLKSSMWDIRGMTASSGEEEEILDCGLASSSALLSWSSNVSSCLKYCCGGTEGAVECCQKMNPCEYWALSKTVASKQTRISVCSLGRSYRIEGASRVGHNRWDVWQALMVKAWKYPSAV